MVHLTQRRGEKEERVSVCNKCAEENGLDDPTGWALVDLFTSIPNELKVVVPPSEKFTRDGFAQIDRYVLRLLSSTSARTGLIISTLDGNIAILLSVHDNEVTIHLRVEWRKEAERESSIREFFKARGLEMIHEYLSGNGNVPDATRNLAYRLSSNRSDLTALTGEVLRDVYGLREDAGLSFHLEGRED